MLTSNRLPMVARAVAVCVLFTLASLTGWSGPAVSETVDISSDVQVRYGRALLDRRTNVYSFTATLTNTSGAPISEPITLKISNIAPLGSTLEGHGQPVGGVYSVPLGSGLAAGASANVPLSFKLVGRDRLRFDLVSTIEQSANARPVADAGADQTAPVGAAVTLNGTGSSDGDGDPLTYAWVIQSAPSGSAALLQGANAAMPMLTPDVAGSYVIALIVNDGAEDSAPDTVTVSTVNSAPFANAGPDQSADRNEAVTLSGAGSTDVDGDSLTYAWTLVSGPSGTSIATSGSGISIVVTPDVNGVYVYQLSVSDGVESDTDTVQIAVETDLPPVADAGADASQPVGAVVMLDGSSSFDPDGSSLTYAWSLISVPQGSAAVLDDATALMPKFSLDVAGTYVAQLIVNDGTSNSAPDTVVISTLNTPPVADAGPDQAVALFGTATLNATGSSDVDGDALTYVWSVLSRPSGSGAEVSDVNALQPTLTPDVAGDYVLQLSVSDGIVSDSDTVTISTLNTVPVADAGPDQSGPVGAAIALNGAGSSDADNDPLTYAWTLASRPAGSAAVLSNPATATPGLLIDYPGTYVVQLIVNDGTVNSALDTMTITTVNSRPVANAGDDSEVFAGQTVTLDPVGSSDADFDPLAFDWSILSKPASAPVVDLISGTEGKVSFRPLVVGTYVAQLIANDGTVDSIPDTVVIEVVTPIAALSATPTVGAAPLEVQLSAQMLGGFGPYTYLWDNGVTQGSFTRLFTQPGDYSVSVTITDSAGFTDTSTETITVLIAPTVAADATPVTGVAPLTVAFSASAVDADGTVELYQWDFTDDGVFDSSDATTATTSFTYSTPGLYTARLRVTDNDGLATDDTVVITVGEPPILNAAATPLVGTAPLDVTFTASASDSDGVIVRYEWDFESDGVTDFVNTADGNTTHTYTEGGVFSATARVFDNDGLLAERSFIVSVSGPPRALPRAYPLTGEAPLTVTFFASGADFDGSPEFYDWDYNGDGNRDIRLIASMNSTYTFTQPGTYQAALTVIDDDTLTDTRTVEITVLPGTESATLNASAAAVPNNGGAPLLVTLVGSAVSTGASVSSYSWDFNNDGTPDFTEDATPARLMNQRLDLGSYSAPAFLDVTGDSLPDMLVGNSAGRIIILPNMGSAEDPAFSNPVDLTFENDVSTVTFVNSGFAKPLVYDVNGDGLQDLLVGANDGRLTLLTNSGTAAAPIWRNLGSLVLDTGSVLDVGNYAHPEAMDYDGDGDLDLIVGNSNGVLALVTRSGTAAQPIWSTTYANLQTDAAVAIDIGSYAAPFVFDMNADGLLDLLVGNSSGQVYLYLNSGSSTGPVWTAQDRVLRSTGGVQDNGSYFAMSSFDFDNDGSDEIFAGNSTGNIYVYDVTAPNIFDLRLIYDEIDVGSYSAPVFVNIDGDTDFDLIAGNSDGQLYLIKNIGSDEMPIYRQVGLLRDSSGTALDVGSYADPTVHDYDSDGDADLLVGNSGGRLFLITNTGTSAAPVWAAPVEQLLNGTGSPIDLGSYSAPTFADINRDGVQDLIVGNSSGNLYQSINLGSNAAPVFGSFTFMTYRQGGTIDVGSYADPVVFDHDGDSVDEVFVGNSDGFVQYFENLNGSAFSLSLESTNFIGLDIGSYASPAAADTDADGDLDFVLGNSNGVLYEYFTRGQVKVTYTAPGLYTAAFTATDTSGTAQTVLVPINVRDAGTPTAYLVSDLVEGNGPLTVTFSFDGNDPDGTIASLALDVDSDGTPEVTQSTAGGYTHVYERAGRWTATLTATDNEGKTIQVTTDILVRPTITTTLAMGSFNPVTGGSGVIQTSLSAADGAMTVEIIDGAGLLVRRLVNGVQRNAGTYQDGWDGRNTAGQIVPDGAYYVVVSVVIDGETIVYDAREDAVFEELTPSRSWSGTFNPYLGSPVAVGYQVPWPAEVTLYFWTRDNARVESTIAPVRTVFLRLPRVAGTYTDYWDGFNDQGVAVAPGQQYPVTLWLYRLPSNAVIITGNTPQITSIDLSPRYFNPGFNPYSSGGAITANLSVTIDKAATLVVDVLNSEGLSVRRITAENRASGLNTVAWDGRDSDGALVAPDVYSLGVVAVDANGNRSLPRYAATSVRY